VRGLWVVDVEEDEAVAGVERLESAAAGVDRWHGGGAGRGSVEPAAEELVL
jgi:hypothetical protein